MFLYSHLRRMLALGAFATLSLVSVQETAAAEEEIRIFSGSSPIFAPVFVADEQGYFKEEGLDVTVRTFPSGAAATEGFRSGSAEFLVAADVPLIYLLTGGDAVMIAQFSSSPDFLLIMAPEGLSGPADLVGKKVGLVTKSASEYLLDLYMKEGGFELMDVEMVNLSPFDQVAAMVRGDVDALSTWKPFDAKVIGLSSGKFDSLAWNGQVGYMLYSGIVVNREFSESNPETVDKVVRALIRASEWLENTEPQAASLSLAAYLKTDAADTFQVIENYDWDMAVSADFTSTMADIEQFLSDRELIQSRVDWNEAYDWSAIKRVKPELVE